MQIYALAILLASPATANPAPASSASDKITQAPPGTVLVKGERVKIGLDVKEAEKMILEEEGLKGAIVSETPEHTVKVDDFYLMVTEVTNEQYAEYVRVSGAKPPLTWGEKAISVGREAFLKADFEARKAAREANQKPPEKKLFDQQVWWDRNWEGAEWAVPTELAAHPVYYVDYAGATGYARWAGMRLMTEFEYQAAVRGKTENTFPWGNDWDDKKYAHSVHFGSDRTKPVGSFPDGATSIGVHDLAGSVWEWTSSPYNAYPKYEPMILKVGKGSRARTIEAYAPFDGNQRIAVGGCYKTPKMALRCTVRRGTERNQAADGVGFRCAATVTPGLDMAQTVLLDDVPSSRRPIDVDYDPDFVVGIDRWQTREGSSIVEGYEIVTSYDSVLFIPVESAPASDKNKLDSLSKTEGLVHLGLLYTTEELLHPALPPGTYFVAYRAGLRKSELPDSGETSDGGDEESSSGVFYDVAAFGADPKEDNLLFLTISNDLVGAVPTRGLESGKLTEGSLSVEEVRNDPKTKPENRITEMDLAIFSTPVRGGASRRGFMIEFPFGLKPGRLDDSWRRP